MNEQILFKLKRTLFKGVLNYPEAVGDFLMLWKIMIKQKMALVCFKEGSDEIIGLNMNFVESKDEQFMEKCYQQVKKMCFTFRRQPKKRIVFGFF